LKFFRSSDLAELIGRVAEDGGDAAGIVIGSRRKAGPSMRSRPFQPDGERGYRFSSMWIGSLSPFSSQPCREPIGGVEQPGIARFRWRNRNQLTHGNDAAVMIGCPAAGL